MNNLPDDWGTYHRSCGLCGSRYHASGVDECSCRECQVCEQFHPPSDMEDSKVCRKCAELGLTVEVGVWADVMEDVVLGLTHGVPVININGTDDRGVCVKSDWNQTVDVVSDERTMARGLPLNGNDSNFRVDLSTHQGMAWALTHGIARGCVVESEDLWCALLGRHWAKQTDDDDREQLALALVAGE